MLVQYVMYLCPGLAYTFNNYAFMVALYTLSYVKPFEATTLLTINQAVCKNCSKLNFHSGSPFRDEVQTCHLSWTFVPMIDEDNDDNDIQPATTFVCGQQTTVGKNKNPTRRCCGEQTLSPVFLGAD